MRQLIQFHIDKNDERQQALEQQLAEKVESTFRRNLRAFSTTVPGIREKLTAETAQRMSLFANKHGEPNVVDYTNGRAFYGEHPQAESEQHANGFCQRALRVDVADKLQSEGGSRFEEVPEKSDVLVVLGIGLGHSLRHILAQRDFAHVILYEPNIDLFKCSNFVQDWSGILTASNRRKTALYFQIGETGVNLLNDITELQTVADFHSLYVYKHYNSATFDSLYEQLSKHSWGELKQSRLQVKHQYSYADFCPSWTPNPVDNNLRTLDSDNPQWQANIAAFEEFFPDIAEQFKQYTPQNWQVVLDGNERYNLLNTRAQSLYFDADTAEIAQQEFDFFSRYPNKNGLVLGYSGEKLKHYHHYQFVIKTESLIESVEEEVAELPEKIKSFILFGVSNPHVLVELLDNYDVEHLFICEPSLDFFYASLFTIDWQQLLQKLDEKECHLYINVGDDGTNLTKDLIKQFYTLGPYLLAQTYIYQSYANDVMDAALVSLQEQLKLLLSMGDYFDHAFYGINHTRQMIEQGTPILLANPAKRLSATEKSVPVVLVGNGPSLDESIHVLNEIAQQCIIVSCGTALKTLYEHDITPDFHCEIEQNRSTFDWACRVGSFEYLKTITLLSCNGIHPDTCSLYKDTYICFKEGEASTVTWSTIINKQALQVLEFAFPTVANFALDLFTSLQPETVYLLGIDLGYTDLKKHHSAKSGYYDESGSELYDYVEKNHTVLQVKGNFQPTVYTKYEFKISKMVMEETLQSRGGDVYNCSNGSYIQGTTPLFLDHILVASSVDDKSQCIDSIKHKLFTPEYSKTAAERFNKLLNVNAVIDECQEIKALVDEARLAPLDADIDELVDAQRKVLVDSLQNNTSLVFYYLYSSVNYASAVLSKLNCSNEEVRQRCIPDCLDYWAECLEKIINTFTESADKRDESASMRWLRIKSLTQNRLRGKCVLLVSNSKSYIEAMQCFMRERGVSYDITFLSLDSAEQHATIDKYFERFDHVAYFYQTKHDDCDFLTRLRSGEIKFIQPRMGNTIFTVEQHLLSDWVNKYPSTTFMQVTGDMDFGTNVAFTSKLNSVFHLFYALCNASAPRIVVPKFMRKENGLPFSAKDSQPGLFITDLHWGETANWLLGFDTEVASLGIRYDGFGDSIEPLDLADVEAKAVATTVDQRNIDDALERARESRQFLLTEHRYV